MPTASDLVTDLPADFETFGQAVATSMADLLGGTTGQILSKASNTDMDFTWTTANPGDITAVTAGTGLSGGGTSGAVTLSIDTATTVDLTTAQTMTNKTLTSPVLTTPTISTINAKGDLLAGTADNTIAALTVGANNTVLTADSSTATGLKWATPSAGGGDFVLINTTSFSGVSSQSVNDVFSSTYDNYVIKFNSSTASGNPYIHIRMRVSGTDTTTNYKRTNIQLDNTASYVSRSTTDDSFRFVGYVQSSFNDEFTFTLANPNQTKVTSATGSWATGAEGSIEYNLSAWGLNDTTSYTGFTFITSTGNVTGSVSVYGYKK